MLRIPYRRAAGLALRAAVLILLDFSAVGYANSSEKVPLVPEIKASVSSVIVVDRLDTGPTLPGTTTLSEAIARAIADPADNVIRFSPSAFTGESPKVTLNEPIAFRGRAGGKDCIDGWIGQARVTLDLSGCQDSGLLVDSDASLVCRGLILHGGGQRAVVVKSEARLLLEKVVVREAAGPGLALFDRAVAELRDCTLTGNRTHAVELHGGATATLERCLLTGNGQSAMAAFETTSVSASSCQFDGNGDWHVVLTQQAHMHLDQSHLLRSQFATADVSGSASLRLTGCLLEQGERFGLFATAQTRLQLADTQLRQHRGRGIELQDQALLTLDRCRIESCGDYGAILFGQARIEARQSVFAYNAGHGVSLCQSASGDFSSCGFLGNRYSGLGAPDAGDGGVVNALRCEFRQNGMRPIYRGPYHLDPLVPTPLKIEGSTVNCVADPGARIQLHLDLAGEASHFFQELQADDAGHFSVDCRDVPEGWVLTATATTAAGTSEFNVLAGPVSMPLLAALIGRTGPWSDDGGQIDLASRVRRWPGGTHLVFDLQNPPSLAIRRYLSFLMPRIADWTGGQMTAEARTEHNALIPPGAVVIPVRYLSADAPQLLGRGGVTFMKWGSDGQFLSPMKIMLAIGGEPRESCPRVLAHEIGHTLGLCHVRAGLLSRMQGSVPPLERSRLNDFSPMMTFYDVLALHLIHGNATRAGDSLGQLCERGLLPPADNSALVSTDMGPETPIFSPVAPQPRPGYGRTPLRGLLHKPME